MKFVWAMMAVALTACATGPGGRENRHPASPAFEKENPEQAFDDLWASAKPEAEINRHLDRLSALFFRAQKFVMDFDSNLEARAKGQSGKSGRPEDAAIRLKLAVARALQEEQREKFVYLYERLLEKTADGASEEKGVKHAHDLLAILWERLGANAKGARRFAYGDLLREMRNEFEDFHNQGLVQAVSGPVVPAVFEKLQFHSPDEIEKFIDETDSDSGMPHGKALAKAAEAEASHADLEFDRAMDEANPAVAPNDEDGRSPQSFARLQPSIQSNGNTFGFDFPKGTWALTFDDGPSEWTPHVLAALQAGGIKGSFFWLAKQLVRPEAAAFVAAAKAAGHTLGNHSYSHARFDSAATNLDVEINQSTKVDSTIYGFRPRFFRCPYGSCIVPAVHRARQMIAALGMIHIEWNVDSLDWQDPDPRSILRRVLMQIKEQGRGIILFHDIHPQSSVVVPRLLNEFFKPNAATMKLLTISEAVDGVNGVAPAVSPRTH